MRITEGNNNLSQMLIILLGVIQIISTFIGGKLMDKWPKRNFLFGG
jgi:predicted MFS family arabinose efflux permease